jgi:hypothetical protein
MDRRVIWAGAVAALAPFSCTYGPGPEAIPEYCARYDRPIAIQRGGREDDINLWEITIHTSDRSVLCWSGRGGWLCDDPAFDGLPSANGYDKGAPRAGRGLPRSSLIRTDLPAEATLGEVSFDVRQNGRVVVEGLPASACDGADDAVCAGGCPECALLIIPEVAP